MLVISLCIPLAYGVYTNNPSGGLLGSAVSGIGLVTIWLVSGYRNAKRLLRLQRSFTETAESHRSQLEIAYNEVLAELEASRQINEDFLKEIGTLSKQAADGRTKDALIEALRRRVANVSAEYNNKQPPGCRGTTLADVLKLTGGK